MKQAGFTLIELVMVIVILAILAAVAIPIYVDLRTEAQVAAEQGVVGGVRAGILTYFIDTARGNRSTYPTQLDSLANGTASGAGTKMFGSVLQQGGVSSTGWTKVSTTSYTGPTGTTYNYNTATGEFL